VLASPAMRRSASILALLVLASAASASRAGAATLALDRGCYLAKQPGLPNGQTIGVRGEGFAPDTQVAFTLGDTAIGSLTSTPSGAVAGQFQAPALAGGAQFRATPALTASDGTSQTAVPVELRRLAADFLPSSGNPRTLRVRFYVYGFGPLLEARRLSTSQPVFEHVFDPRGRRRATIAAGRTTGPCGDLRTTRRRILPFRTVANGRWRFVFTTSRRYSRRAAPLASVGFVVRTVFRPL